jgi:hypothetical protein
MTITLTTTRPDAFVSFNSTFEIQSNDDWDAAIFVDGVQVAGTQRNFDFFGGSLLGLTPARIDGFPGALHALVQGLTAASHTFTVRWKVNGGTARATDVERSLIVFELL